MRRPIWMVVLAFVASLAAAGPASAGISFSLTMNLSPTSGVPGTAVTLTSTDPCPTGGGLYTVTVVVANQPDLVNGPFLGTAVVAANGSWSFPATIAANAAIGTSITFYAECQGTLILGAAGTAAPNATSGSITLASYTPVVFAVTAPATTTTTTTTTTPSSTTTTTTASTPVTMTAVPDFMYPLESCQLSAKGFAPGTGVEITVYSAPLVIGTVVASPAGEVSTVWQVPAGFASGVHTVVMRGNNSLGASVEVSANVTVGSLVQAQPVTPVPPVTNPQPVRTLPTTGSASTMSLLLGGALLIGVGVAALAVARRRQIG